VTKFTIGEFIMRKTIGTALVLFVALFVAGCGGSPSASLAAAYNDTAAAMATIKDEGSLKEAKPKILKAAGRIKDAMLATYKADGSSAMTADQKKAVDDAQANFTAALGKMSAVPGGADLGFEVMKTMTAFGKQ
jgi:hypothetical protein